MSGKLAAFAEADVKPVIGAAKKEGLRRVEVRMGEASAIVPLREEDQKPVETDEEISL